MPAPQQINEGIGPVPTCHTGVVTTAVTPCLAAVDITSRNRFQPSGNVRIHAGQRHRLAPRPRVPVHLDDHGNTTTLGFFPLSTTPHQRLVYKGGGCPKTRMDQCAPMPPPPATGHSTSQDSTHGLSGLFFLVSSLQQTQRHLPQPRCHSLTPYSYRFLLVSLHVLEKKKLARHRRATERTQRDTSPGGRRKKATKTMNGRKVDRFANIAPSEPLSIMISPFLPPGPDVTTRTQR